MKAGWGVGTRVNPAVVKHVCAAITTMLKRATDYPKEPAALGILQSDLDALTADLAAIQAADAQQEKARATAPKSTQMRNQTANRIVAATKKIAGAGVVEFALEPEREVFQALIGAGNANEGGKGAGGGDGKGNGGGGGGGGGNGGGAPNG